MREGSSMRRQKIITRFYERKIEAHESQRCRIQESGKRCGEDHITEGLISMTHHNLVHRPTRVLEAMKIHDATAAVDKEWHK